jgi:hypothetical protein
MNVRLANDLEAVAMVKRADRIPLEVFKLDGQRQLIRDP